MSAALSNVTESSHTSTSVPGASVQEMFLMALGSIALLLVEVLMSAPRILLGRYLWLDELWTKLIESEPSVRQSLIALKHSGDPTPPTYHLLARASWGVLGGSGETAFRTLALVSMWIALVLIYAILRRTFTVLPCLLAVLAFWSSPPIIAYAFYARPYAPLLAATAGFCLIYGADNKGLAATTLTAALAALICTLHYFGILALAAAVLGDALARRESMPAMIRRWLPAAAGPIALAFCWPFVHEWHNGQTVFSYLPPQTLGFAVQAVFLSWGGAIEATAILVFALALSALAGLISHLLGWHGGEARALSALAVPTMTTRYMIPGLLGVTGLVAVIASYVSPRILVGTVMLLILLGAFNLQSFSASRSKWQTSEDRMMNIGQGDQLAVVTFNAHEAYLLYAYAYGLRSRVFIADLRTTHRAELSRSVLLGYDLEKKWSALFPDLPKLVDPDQLRSMGRFHLVNSEAPVLAEQENRPEIPLPLQRVAQLLSFQNVGDLYEVRPN